MTIATVPTLLNLPHIPAYALSEAFPFIAALVLALSFRRALLRRKIRPVCSSTIEARKSVLNRTLVYRIRDLHVEVVVWHPLLLAIVSVLVPLLALPFGFVIVARSIGAQRRRERTRLRAWGSAVPDLVELVRLALSSGCTTHLTLRLIAKHAGGAVSEMLERTSNSLREGRSAGEALMELQERVGPPIRPLCSALLGSERYGLPVSATLEALAVEARLARQRDAELRSRRLPVLLIFPLVVCILPAFALLTVVPLLGGGLSSLSW